MPTTGFDATILVTTLNRSAELRRCLNSLLAQEGCYEFIVIDDGSSDDTAAMMRHEFPQMRLVQNSAPSGCSKARNQGIAMANADIVFVIDDDAYATDTQTIRATLADFNHPQVAAVAMPYFEHGVLLKGNQLGKTEAVTDWFAGGANAVRKEVFLRLGGFRETYFMFGEEPDLCIRLLQSGYLTKHGSGQPLIHQPSAIRDSARNLRLRLRHEFCFKWCFTPAQYLLPSLGIHLVNIFDEVEGSLWQRLTHIFEGLGAIWFMRSERRPVDREVYRLWRKLRAGSLPLSEAMAHLAQASIGQDAATWHWDTQISSSA